MHILCIFFN